MSETNNADVLIVRLVAIQEMNEAWERLKALSQKRQERLFGAHELQNFNRWVTRKT